MAAIFPPIEKGGVPPGLNVANRLTPKEYQSGETDYTKGAVEPSTFSMPAVTFVAPL